MPETDDLLRHALGAAKTGWHRYIATLGAVNLALCVDLLTGSQFLAGDKQILIGGFTIARPAFSFTYSVLFGTFVLWAIGSAKTVREMVPSEFDVAAKDAIEHAPEYRLWTLSPISSSKPLRIVFWLLVGDGLLLLGSVTLVHLLSFNVPPETTPEVYLGIGVFSGFVFVFSIFAFWRWVHRDWKSIRDSLCRLPKESEKTARPTPPSPGHSQ